MIKLNELFDEYFRISVKKNNKKNYIAKFKVPIEDREVEYTVTISYNDKSSKTFKTDLLGKIKLFSATVLFSSNEAGMGVPNYGAGAHQAHILSTVGKCVEYYTKNFNPMSISFIAAGNIESRKKVYVILCRELEKRLNYKYVLKPKTSMATNTFLVVENKTYQQANKIRKGEN